MKLIDFLRHLFFKAESGLDKLITAEDRINLIIRDTENALDLQVINAKKLEASRLEFTANLTNMENRVNQFKHQCEVLKKTGVPNDNDDLRIAATQYLENKKILDDLYTQKNELDEMWDRVQKMLRQLKLNKALLYVKAEALKTKIHMYELTKNITDSGVIDIDTTFNEINEVVNKIQYENEASRKVDNIVNGHEEQSVTFTNAEVDNFLNSL